MIFLHLKPAKSTKNNKHSYKNEYFFCIKLIIPDESEANTQN